MAKDLLHHKGGGLCLSPGGDALAYSVFNDIVEDTAEQRRTFFKLVYGSAPGFVCISYKLHNENKMFKKFFEWPGELEEMLENISAQSQQLVHAYFCPSLYGTPGDKHKEFISTCTNVWADLDECDPRLMMVTPSILTQTSPGRYHALWLLEDPVEPEVAENISRRIAYYHADQGADKSGWDLSQLLRIPYTPNYKYGDINEAPVVTVLSADRLLYRPSDFSKYPEPKALKVILDKPVPKPENLNITASEILQRYHMNEYVYKLFEDTPEGDWSTALWNLIRMCVEAGVAREEAFVLCNEAACNKYRRDGRPETALWNDIQRGYIKDYEKKNVAPTASATIPDLMSFEEIQLVQTRNTFIERYIEWASHLTDAAIQYHQSGAFMILSALLSGNVKLLTNFGKIIPNLWFMLLGNTTLTRKTTAMNIAMGLLYEIDETKLLATDGSLEGILVGLRDRPRQPSIFLRDEFTGLLEVIAHKDYMAGFAEQLTKLYDGEPLRRLLRKETIEINDPVFLMYVGGIKTKTQMMITEELVMGGFLPRFVIITAEPDPSRVQDIGPPVERDLEQREFLINELTELFHHYVDNGQIVRKGENLGKAGIVYKAVLTPEAWRRYNEYERLLTATALDAGLDHLTPVYDRLAKSTLKAAMLIAASTQRDSQVVVTLQDLLHAIYYAKEWRMYASEIVNGIGKTHDERLMDRIYLTIQKSTLGVGRGELMSLFYLDAKRADLIFKTMEQRGVIFAADVDGERRYQAH